MDRDEKLNTIFLGLGERLRAFRKSKGLRQMEFAKVCGIDNKSLSKLELGKISITDVVLYNLIINYADFDAHYILTGQQRTLTMTPTEGVEI
jgi:transcriptional regulator with XRE-family HTH domain